MAVTLLGSATFNTNSGTHTVTSTPAQGDLIVIVAANTGNTSAATPTDDQGGVYVQVNTCVKATSADRMGVFVRTTLVPSGVSTVFTHAPGASSGGGIAVLKVTGMKRTGSQAIRQSAIQSNQASGTPTPVLSVAALTGNALIGAVFNGASPATMTERSSPAWSERADVGYGSPTTGLEVMSIDSGETGTSIAWGSSSGSAFCSIVVELDTSAAPAMSTLTDNFDDNSENGSIWPGSYNSSATRAETGGQLVITLANLTGGSNYCGYVSAAYNMTSDAAYVQVAQVGNTATGADTGIQLNYTSSDFVNWIEEAGTLFAEKTVAGVNTVVGSFAYNASTHAWWRIRESAGTTFWDTSTDGSSWTNRFSAANPIPVTSLQVNVFAGTYQSETSPGTAKFDNFNTVPAAVTVKNLALLGVG